MLCTRVRVDGGLVRSPFDGQRLRRRGRAQATGPDAPPTPPRLAAVQRSASTHLAGPMSAEIPDPDCLPGPCDAEGDSEAPAEDGAGDGDPEEGVGEGEGGERELWGLPRKRVAEPLLVLLVAQAVLFLGIGVLAPALPLFGNALGLGNSFTGIVISAPALAMLLLAVPCGRATDTRGRKPMMVVGMALIAIADVATGLSRTVAVLLAARLLLGVGRSIAESGERAFLADLCARAPAQRGRILAAQQTVYTLGIVVGPALGGVVIERFGVFSAFYAVAAAAAVCMALYLGLPETLPKGAAAAPGAPPPAPPPKTAWWRLLRSPAQCAMLLAIAANTLGVVAKLAVVPLLLVGPEFGASASDIGSLFSYVALMGLCAAPVGGWLADAIGYARLVVGACGACGAGLVLGSQATAPAVLMAALGLWGAGAGALTPALQACAQDLAPEGQEGEALTYPKIAADVTFLVGPLALGAVSDLWAPKYALLLCGGLSFGVALLFWGLVVRAQPHARRPACACDAP